MEIRRARSGDAAELAAFAARAFADAFAYANRPEDMSEYLDRTYRPELQAAELADPAMRTLVAEVDRDLAGFAQLRLGRAPTCIVAAKPVELYRFYVDRRWHGHGVAQALMNAAVASAELERGDALWLGVWERNERAIAFYRKCGFAAVGSQPFMLGSDRQTDTVMRRPLGGG